MNIASLPSGVSAAQEAQETAAQTRAEATKGDQQAVRKLANNQAKQVQADVEKSSASADSRLLNVKA